MFLRFYACQTSLRVGMARRVHSTATPLDPTPTCITSSASWQSSSCYWFSSVSYRTNKVDGNVAAVSTVPSLSCSQRSTQYSYIAGSDSAVSTALSSASCNARSSEKNLSRDSTELSSGNQNKLGETARVIEIAGQHAGTQTQEQSECADDSHNQRGDDQIDSSVEDEMQSNLNEDAAHAAMTAFQALERQQRTSPEASDLACSSVSATPSSDLLSSFASNSSSSLSLLHRSDGEILLKGRPQPPEENSCCGNMCANCVWNDYFRDVELYEVALKRNMDHHDEIQAFKPLSEPKAEIDV